MKKLRITYKGEELSRKEKGIFLSGMAIGMICCTAVMVIIRLLPSVF